MKMFVIGCQSEQVYETSAACQMGRLDDTWHTIYHHRKSPVSSTQSVLDAWRDLKNSFQKCCISKTLDGTEDDILQQEGCVEGT